jgi:uncharacterized protein with HEPN domain
MYRKIELYLNDILVSIKRIEDYVKNQSFGEFSKDQKTIDAVIRNLEIIGEAVKKIPNEIRSKYTYDWRSVAGLKDILIHKYFGVSIKIVWDIIKNEILELAKLIKKILEDQQFQE